MSINRAVISGNITRDSELRHTKSDMPVLSFTVAVNERKKGASGDWEDVAHFIDCTLFGSRGEKVAQYLTKGTHVTVDGKLRQETWEKEGQKRSKIALIVNDIDFQSSGRKPERVEASFYDEDCPF